MMFYMFFIFFFPEILIFSSIFRCHRTFIIYSDVISLSSLKRIKITSHKKLHNLQNYIHLEFRMMSTVFYCLYHNQIHNCTDILLYQLSFLVCFLLLKDLRVNTYSKLIDQEVILVIYCPWMMMMMMMKIVGVQQPFRKSKAI